MKVAILTTSFPRFKGDYAGIFIYELAKEIVRKGISVKVIAPHCRKTTLHENLEGLNIYRFRYMLPSKLENVAYGYGIPTNIKKNIFVLLGIPIFLICFLLKALKITRDCDIIHANWSISALVGLPCSRLWKKPLVLTLHGSDINWLKNIRIMNMINLYIFKKANKIIVVSNSLKQLIINQGIPESKIAIIHSGVDINKFTYEKKNKISNSLIWFGRMVPVKGLEYLIKSLKLVSNKISDIKLILIGDGSERKNVERLTKQLGLSKNVLFEGFKSHDYIAEQLKHADIFVLSSLSEGFPVSVVEAMSAGLPVVSTNVGGISEVVTNGENGFLVAPRDTKEMAEKVIKLMEDQGLWIKIRENNRGKIEKEFTWNKIANDIKILYESIYLAGAPRL